MFCRKVFPKLQEKNKVILGDDYFDNGGYVVCEGDGRLINPGLFNKRFAQVLKTHNYKKSRLHDARHFFASNMISIGVPIPTVASMLGHASPILTLNTYSHVLDSMHQEAIEKLDADIERAITSKKAKADSEGGEVQ